MPSGASFIWLRGRFDSPGASDFGRLLSFFVEFCALPFGRFACNLIWLLAGPKARFWLTQDFRPRLSSVAPAGLVLGGAVFARPPGLFDRLVASHRATGNDGS